jgi:DHA3 family tetracycline resistance protein-like MFS transporter
MAEGVPFYERVGVLRPLQHRDFRLLWLGQTVSMIGDGIYIFAVAWFIYNDLHATPATFALVGFAWSLPQVILLAATGALSDRMDRRHLMIIGDLLRLAAITAIGTLIIMDAMTPALLVALVFPYGAGQAIFWPAFSSIIPSIVPEEHLVQANSIGSTVRPLAWLVIGPMIGAAVVSTAGTGWAFIVDAGTFAISAVCIWMMHVRADQQPDEATHIWTDVREGIAYVRRTRWVRWGLLGGMVSLFCVWGPWETLVPYVVRNEMSGTEFDLALVFGAGGVGSVIASLVMAQREGLPHRPLTVMYICWAIGMGMTTFFGLVANVPQAMVVSFIAEASIAVLVVIWFTCMQRLVPSDLLGRVSSLDWMITILGAPVSFLVVGPLAAAFGADAVLIVAGALGAGATVIFMFAPGARDPERDGSLALPARVDPGGQGGEQDPGDPGDREGDRDAGHERSGGEGDRRPAEPGADGDPERIHQQRRREAARLGALLHKRHDRQRDGGERDPHPESG